MFKQMILAAVVLTLLLCEPPRLGRTVQAAELKAAVQGPLVDYVAKEDQSYKWSKRREGKLGTGDYVELTLTSQTWKNIVWKHQLFIYKPAEVPDASQALLLIAGGRWNPELEQPPTDANTSLITVHGLGGDDINTHNEENGALPAA